jgi:hypothetical protein
MNYGAMTPAFSWGVTGVAVSIGAALLWIAYWRNHR